jgi:hypothetical protein
MRLLLDPPRQRAGAVAEGRVARELRLGRRDVAIVVTDEMDVAGRDPATLEKRRADEDTVHPAERCRQRVRFGRKVTAQGRIAAAGDDERHSSLPARVEQIRGDLPVECRSTVLGERARVRQDEEEWRGRSQLRGQRRHIPAGQYRNVMYRLYSGRVVIEGDDFAPGLRHCRPDTFFQTWIVDRWRQRMSQRLPDHRFGHDVIGFTTKLPGRNMVLCRGSTPGKPLAKAGKPLPPGFTRLRRARQAIHPDKADAQYSHDDRHYDEHRQERHDYDGDRAAGAHLERLAQRDDAGNQRPDRGDECEQESDTRDESQDRYERR